jgi:hypothetical protein
VVLLSQQIGWRLDGFLHDIGLDAIAFIDSANCVTIEATGAWSGDMVADGKKKKNLVSHDRGFGYSRDVTRPLG